MRSSCARWRRLHPSVPVLVVSSDREVQVLSEAEGATVVSTDTFLRALRA